MDDSLTGEIEAVLAAYVEAWNDYEMRTLRRMWDAEEAEPIYVAEECDPLIGWEALARYWHIDNPGASDHLIKYSELRVRLIAPETAHAFFRLRWNVFIHGNPLYPRPIGNEVRVSAFLRRRDEDWRFFHWIESPLASMIQMKRFHERNVDPELYENLERKGIVFPR